MPLVLATPDARQCLIAPREGRLVLAVVGCQDNRICLGEQRGGGLGQGYTCACCGGVETRTAAAAAAAAVLGRPEQSASDGVLRLVGERQRGSTGRRAGLAVEAPHTSLRAGSGAVDGDLLSLTHSHTRSLIK